MGKEITEHLALVQSGIARKFFDAFLDKIENDPTFKDVPKPRSRKFEDFRFHVQYESYHQPYRRGQKVDPVVRIYYPAIGGGYKTSILWPIENSKDQTDSLASHLGVEITANDLHVLQKLAMADIKRRCLD